MNVSFCLLPLLPSDYLCLSPFVLQTKGLCFLVHGVENSCQQQFPNLRDTTIERDYIVPLPCFSRFSGKGLRVPRLECPSQTHRVLHRWVGIPSNTPTHVRQTPGFNRGPVGGHMPLGGPQEPSPWSVTTPRRYRWPTRSDTTSQQNLLFGPTPNFFFFFKEGCFVYIDALVVWFYLILHKAMWESSVRLHKCRIKGYGKGSQMFRVTLPVWKPRQDNA